MKKKIVAAILVSGLAITTVASANWNGQRGNSNCSKMQMQGVASLDEATQAKIKQFHVDNQALIKEMAMKRAEKRALMQGDNPDPKLAAQLAGEMFDLRTTIRLKAEEAGVAQYVGPMNKGCNGKGGRGGNGGNGKYQSNMNN